MRNCWACVLITVVAWGFFWKIRQNKTRFRYLKLLRFAVPILCFWWHFFRSGVFRDRFSLILRTTADTQQKKVDPVERSCCSSNNKKKHSAFKRPGTLCTLSQCMGFFCVLHRWGAPRKNFGAVPLPQEKILPRITTRILQSFHVFFFVAPLELKLPVVTFFVASASNEWQSRKLCCFDFKSKCGIICLDICCMNAF